MGFRVVVVGPHEGGGQEQISSRIAATWSSRPLFRTYELDADAGYLVLPLALRIHAAV